MNLQNDQSLKRLLGFMLVGAAAGAIGMYLRLYPLLTFSSFDSSEKATVFVLSNIREKVISGIEKNFPNLSVAQKNKLIKEKFDSILSSEKKNLQKTVSRVAKEIDQKEPAPVITYGPYLLASDGYYYLSLTENIIKTGRLGQKVKGSKYFNDLMLTPLGFWEPLNLHPYTGYFIYKIMRLFDPHVPLMYAVSFTPLVITLLALIAFLFLCALFECSLITSFISSIFLLIAPIFLKRSMFGWYDDDPNNVFFLFLILALILYGLHQRKNPKHCLLCAGCAAVTITLYALYWHGCVFLFSVLILSGIACLLYNHFLLRAKEHTKTVGLFFGIVVGGTLIGISLTFGLEDFFVLFKEGWRAVNHFINPQLSPWPNLYIGVGELNKPTPHYLSELVGGYFVVFCALAGLAYYFHQSWLRPREKDPLLILVLMILLAAAAALAFGALRFALLCVIPVSILCAIGLEFFFEHLRRFVSHRISGQQYNKMIKLILIGIIALILVVPHVITAYKGIPLLLNKIFNSTWEKALLKINNETPENSIVNTWWPPGHFIKAVAKRRVTFDGATINNPQGYWLANVFLTANEQEAAGILRMLNNSANQATEYLLANGLQLSETIALLKTIIALDETQARGLLRKNISDDQIDNLFRLTHAPPPASYLLVYNDLVEKNLELKFVGGWDFKKVEDFNANPENLKNLPASNSVAYLRFLWDLAGGAYRYSGVLSELSQQDGVLTFEENVNIDLADKRCFIRSKKFGQGIPKSIFYAEGDHVVEKKFAKANLSFSVLLTQDEDGQYGCVLLDEKLAKSLMVTLYFFDGKGLKYFRPFAKEKDLTRRTQIFVYEVDWTKFTDDIKKAGISTAPSALRPL